MNLGEIIEEIREVTDDRDLEGYEQEDLLTPDSRLIRLINVAQNDFCLRTGHIRDTYSLHLEPNKPIYRVPDAVIRVLSAYRNNTSLAFKTARTQYSVPPEDTQAYCPNTTQAAYITDVDDNRVLRFLFTPEDDDDLRVRVWRRPKPLVDKEDESEIPYQYRYALVSYVCSKICTGHDVDIGDKGTRRQHQENYLLSVQDARRELRLFENTTLNFAVGGF